ncbi:unnamed protein product [Laminaria digitata]
MFSERQFLRNQRKYNGLFSLTMLGAAPTPTWTQPSYPSMLQLHGRAYHRIMDAFRGQHNESTPVVNKARMYIYDAQMMQQARTMNGLDMDTVSALSASLASHNSRIRHNDESADNVGIEFAQVTRQTHGSVVGDAPPPTGKEFAALIFNDDPETRAQRFVYTFPRAGPDSLCHRPRFVPLWSPAYESLQYRLLFFNGESGWNPVQEITNTFNHKRQTYQKIFSYARQRLMCEKVFEIVSVVSQEWACDIYSRQEENTLSFIGSSQCQKIVTTYSALSNAVSNAPTGKRLPSSFLASPANRKKRQLD